MTWKYRNQGGKGLIIYFPIYFQMSSPALDNRLHVNKYFSGDQCLIHPKFSLFALKILSPAYCSSLGELTSQIMCFLYFSAKGMNFTAY